MWIYKINGIYYLMQLFLYFSWEKGYFFIKMFGVYYNILYLCNR